MLGKNLIQAAAGAGGEVLGVEDVFSTWLYTGNGSTQTITNGIDLAGEGGMVWMKSRSTTGNSYTVFNDNGTLKDVYTNGTTGAGTATWTSWNNDGFYLSGVTNNNATTYASWTFRKAEKFFDVVTYTGNNLDRTIAHNLGSIPGCIIVKRVDSTSSWYVHHRSLPADDTLLLNSTAAKINDPNTFDNTYPTSTVFSVGAGAATNVNGGTYVAYLFAHDAGGFGDDGTESVIKCGLSTAATEYNLGWEPQWILVKNPNTSFDNWRIYDSMRMQNLVNYANKNVLNANNSDAESSDGAMQFTATGFKYEFNAVFIAIRRGPMKTPTSATEVFKPVAQTSQGNVTTDFPVDMVIMGDRDSTWGYNWSVQDRLRGNTGVLFTSAATSENTGSLSKFDSNTFFKDGWLSGSEPGIYECFRRAPGFFDVVAYTGTGVVRTISHRLGVIPELWIIKNRTSAYDWAVGSTYLSNKNKKYLFLNTTTAEPSVGFTDNIFNDPTPTTIGIGAEFPNDYIWNRSGQNYIAYLFASCPGVSKVGSYTGTGTTLNIDCGFTAGARFVLIKRTDSTGSWYVWDTARGIVSGNDSYLLLNSSAAENTSTDYIDPLSSGFQISSTAPAAINASGGSFIFLAIA